MFNRKSVFHLNKENINPEDLELEMIDYGLEEIDISEPEALEILLNNIPGVVDNGIFAFNKPGVVLVSD